MKPTIYIAMLLVLISLTYAVDDLYNMTDLDNTNNFYEYTVALNTISHNSIGLSILLIVYSIAFMVNFGNTGNIWGGLVAGAFIGMLSATILLSLDLIIFNHYLYIMGIGIISGIVAFLFARG